MFQCLYTFWLKPHKFALCVFVFQKVMKNEVAEERFEWASTKVPTLCVIIRGGRGLGLVPVSSCRPCSALAVLCPTRLIIALKSR